MIKSARIANYVSSARLYNRKEGGGEKTATCGDMKTRSFGGCCEFFLSAWFPMIVGLPIIVFQYLSSDLPFGDPAF